MLKILVSIYDKKAESYLQPMFVATLGVAYRDIQRELRNEQSPLAQYTDDFELWQLGSFDDETAHLETTGFPKKLCDLTQLQEKPHVQK